MKAAHTTRRTRQSQPRSCLGPIADLEAHLPENWWAQLFNAIYVKTDGDVVENAQNSERDVDLIIELTGIQPDYRILDLCCGQGRHSIELARRGFRHVTGIDRSRYLIRLARKRAEQAGLSVTFREGDARNPRLPDDRLDCVMLMGNSFGYFANPDDDVRVLQAVGRCLSSSGIILLDITEGDWIREHFDPRSWEWVDGHHFVCRERSLSSDNDRLISREVVVHDERGVLADQLYAERLYSRERITEVLHAAGFRDVRYHGTQGSLSDRDQDLGMMARRMFLTATAPRKVQAARPRKTPTLDVAVLLGDPRLPDPVKRDGKFNEEDFDTIEKLKDALADTEGYRFRYLDNHATLQRDLALERTDLVFNLCDEGWNNDPFMELNVPSLMEILSMPYTGGGPACLAYCYDKALVRAVAESIDLPVPLETYIRAGDQGATLPSVFPAILKPNFGDSSIGIDKNSVVNNQQELLEALRRLRGPFPDRPILVQEFLTGDEFSVCLIGNPGYGLRALPLLKVDYSRLDPALPRILGYESKWLPNTPYWTQIRYCEADIDEREQASMVDCANKLFERLRCRDYARFDFRMNAAGDFKLLEVNPNPGWCWDGKVNLMAGFGGMRYSELLQAILDAARDRNGLGIVSSQKIAPAAALARAS